ncbi:hypothetical protein Avbf_05309, partial [Armadillidium vulgare]
MADLKKPETMLSTNLRKHIATMSQVLNLSQPELEELCKLMGHDIRVHTSYYRLPDDAVQLGKLTKLLIAAQNGDILKYRNKTIEEIELNPEEFISEDEKDEEDENDVDVDDNDEEDSNYYTSLHGKSRIKRTSNPTSGKFKRRPWTHEEKDRALIYFKTFVEKQKLPGKEECSKFLEHHPNHFKGRNWLHVKNFIRNKIVSIKIIQD